MWTRWFNSSFAYSPVLTGGEDRFLLGNERVLTHVAVVYLQVVIRLNFVTTCQLVQLWLWRKRESKPRQKNYALLLVEETWKLRRILLLRRTNSMQYTNDSHTLVKWMTIKWKKSKLFGTNSEVRTCKSSLTKRLLSRVRNFEGAGSRHCVVFDLFLVKCLMHKP